MACCSSVTAEEKAQRRWEEARTKDIELRSKTAKQQDRSVKKLLLLGAGESGKSTLFKQMIHLYGKGYSQSDLESFRSVIYNNTLSAMKTLIDISQDFEELWFDDPANDDMQEDDCPYLLPDQEADTVRDAPMESDISPDLADAIDFLWGDPGIRATFERRSEFQLIDSAKYFFEKVKTLSRPDYVPSRDDVLRARVRTTGIVETTFEIEENIFKMFDVGGQRNERKKWIHCFENVTSVIFVAAISEYDQSLYEDETTNRMTETLELFEEIVNSRWFRSTSVILFLNKRDLFADKIKKVPLTVCPSFHDYAGTPHDYDEACGYIRQQFEVLNHTSNELFAHITCATDSDQIFVVFNAVKDIVIRVSLNQAGLMM